jgi:hypothetical protein
MWPFSCPLGATDHGRSRADACRPLHTIVRERLAEALDDGIVVGGGSMATNNDDDTVTTQERRIETLKHRAQQSAGGMMRSWESEELSADQREDFWRRVRDYENAPLITDAQRLQADGIDLPDPDALDDSQLTAKLSQLIEALAGMDVFITSTNHLSDRQLYDRLWRHSLREEEPFMPGFTSHLDLVSTGSEEDIHAWMKYYADEDTRRDWLKDVPDYDMPMHEDPPYDRDRHLP